MRHKWYVFVECVKAGEIWRGITHDLSKFRPDEFIPYAKYFYEYMPHKDEIDFFGDDREYEEEFNYAWLRHIHRNPHHWQHWMLQEDDGDALLMEMPLRYKREMLADWRGAGKAINGFDDTTNWYLKNRDKMKLTALTKTYIERKLGIKDE